MRVSEPRSTTCPICRTVNFVDGFGVPKIQCSGCGKVLVLRRPAHVLETRVPRSHQE